MLTEHEQAIFDAGVAKGQEIGLERIRHIYEGIKANDKMIRVQHHLRSAISIVHTRGALTIKKEDYGWVHDLEWCLKTLESLTVIG